MKTPAKLSVFISILTGLISAVFFATSASAQPIEPSTSTSYTVVTAAGNTGPDNAKNVSKDYIIDDGVTLTFSALGQWLGNNNGAIFGATTTGFHFTATTATSSGNGNVVLDGASSAAAPLFANAGRLGGAFYMVTGNNYTTIISGSSMLMSGTVKGFWATSHGGAVYMNTGNNNAIFQNIVFDRNGSNGANAAYGGAIYAGSAGSQSVSLTNVTFSNNQANSTSSTATASAYGGAIWYAGSGTLSLNNVSFLYNSATAGTTSAGSPGSSYGGALYLNTTTGMKVTGSNLIFTGNSVMAANASGVGTAFGGALYMSSAISGTLSNVYFSQNSAQGLGGAIYMQTGANLTINTGTFTGNYTSGGMQATSGNGGAIYAASANTVLTLNDAVFISNTASGGTAGAGGAIGLNSSAVLNYNVTQDQTSYGNVATGTGTTISGTSGGFLNVSGGSLVNFNIAANKTLTIGLATDTSGADTIAASSGTLSINQVAGNSGAVVLNANSPTNKLLVNVYAGSLLLGNQNASFGGTIIAGAGGSAATLGGAGTFSGNVTLKNSSTLRVGYTHTSAQTLNIGGDLVLGAGSILDFGIYSGTTNDKLVIGGTINQQGASTLNINNLLAGTYDIIDVAGGLGTFDTNLLTATLNGVAIGSGTISYNISSGTSVLITLTGGGFTPTNNNVLLWTGQTNNTWISGVSNWSGSSSQFQTGDAAVFSDTYAPSAPHNVAVNAAGVQASQIIVDGTGNYTFTGGVITTSTSDSTLVPPLEGMFIKRNTGTATFANSSNNFQGGMEIDNGAVVINNAGQLGVSLQNLYFGGNDGTRTARVLINGNTIFDGVVSGSAQYLTIGATGTNFAGGFLVADGATMTVSNNDFTPYSFNSGAVLVLANSKLTIAPQTAGGTGQVVFSNNKTSVGADGGAIYNKGIINITNALFTSNTAVDDGHMAYGLGGAIENDGGLATFTNVAFTNNGGAFGGAIENRNSGTITLNNASFSGNTASYFGGAISNDGLFTGSNVTFIGNNAVIVGGAIYNTGTMMLTSATFANNQNNWYGGAIENGVNAMMTLYSASLTNNTSVFGGAIDNDGLFTGSNVTLVGNNATAFGGAINNTGAMTVISATLSNNSATSYGGAIENGSGATLTLSNAAFITNTGSFGGAIDNDGFVTGSNVAFVGNHATGEAGAIFSSGTVTLTDATFTNNTAANFAGAIENNGVLNLKATQNASFTGNGAGAMFGGGFLLLGSATAVANIDVAAGVTLTIGDATATDHTLDSIAGVGGALINKTGAGALTLNAANSYFTGTTNINAGSLILGNVNATLGGNTIVNNTGLFGGTGTAGNVTVNNGGAIMVGLTHANAATTAPETFSVVGALTLNAGATLQYDLYSGNQSDLLNVGSLTVNSSTVALNNALTGNYKLISSAATLAASTTTSFATVAAGSALTGRTQATYSITGSDLWLSILTSNTTLTWTGLTTLNWNSADANWTGGDTKFVSGDSVTFDDSAAAAKRTVNVASAVIASDMIVNTSGTYAFTGAGGITTGTAGSTLTTATGALTKLGTGVLDFTGQTGANTFNAGINLAAGSIIGNVTTLGTGTGAVTTAASTTLTFAQAADATYAANITGAGDVTKTLAGNLTLSGTTNYTGATNLAAGALTLGNAAQLANSSTITLAASTTLNTGALAQTLNNLNGAGNIATGAAASALTLANAADTLYSGTITGAAAVTKTGASTLTLTGNNTATGATTITSGTLQLGDGTSANGTLASAAAITNNAALALNHGATSGTMANVITGNGTITKLAADTGTLTLTGNSSAFTGTTNINAGSLVLNGANAKLGGLTNLASGAALAGNGSLGDLITAGNNVITVGLTHNDSTVTSPQTLTLTGTLSLAASTTLRYDLYAGNQSDVITVGSLVRTGTTTIDLNSTTNTGTYTLITSAAALATTSTDNLITTLNGNALGQRSQVNYSIVGNNLDMSLLTINLAGLVWNGTNTGLWQNNYSNWKTSDGKFLNGDSVIFDDTLAGTRAVTVDAAGVAAVDMTINTTGSYVFTGGAITTSTANTTLATGTGALVKLGTGIAILNNSGNTFTAGIINSAGTLQGNVATLGTGTAGITNNAVLVFDQATSGTYTNAIVGTGSLVKQNTGALTLTGSTNTYTGGINVAGGTLNLKNSGTTTQGAINIASTALLNIADGAGYTIQNALTGSGTFAIALDATSSTVALTAAAGNAFAGTVKLGQSAFTLNSAAATALTAATLDLAAGNTTTVASATQQIGNLALDGAKVVFSATVPADPAAAGVIKTNALALNSGTVQVSIPSAGLANPMPPGSNLLSQDDGTTVTKLITATTVTGNASNITLVDQNNNTIGSTTAQSVSITEGGVQVATGTYNYALNSTGGLNVNYKLTALALAANQTLHLAPDAGATGAAASFSATISGNGNLSINAANAPVTLAAANTYTGTTTLTSGTLIAGANSALGAATNTLNLAANTAFNLNGNTQTLGNLVTAANSGVTLGAASGTLTIGANGLSTAASSTINLAGGALVLNGGTSAGALTGAGALNLASGTTTLAAASTALTASTNIAANAAAVLKDVAALGSGTINLAAGTSALTLSPTASGTFANTIAGNGTLNTAGSGTITIAKANTAFTGQTNVTDGRLIAANTQALGAGAVNVAAPANLEYAVSGTIANAIAGSGTLNLTASTGTTTLAAANTIANINVLNNANVLASNVNALGSGNTALNINNATVILGQTGMTLGDVALAGAGKLAFAAPVSGAYKTDTAKSLATTGSAATLVFNTNIGQGLSDKLNVSGAANGAYNIALNNTGIAPASGTVALNLITAASGNAIYTPTKSTIDFGGMRSYDISAVSSAGGLTIQAVNNNQISDLGGYIVDTVGAAQLVWYSELDTLAKRMGDIRLDTRAKPGMDVWARAYAQRFNVNSQATGAGFSDNQYGTEIGADFGGRQNDGWTVYLGGFFGYGNSSRTVDDSIGYGHTDSVYGGVYATVATPDNWYADVVVKYNDFTNNYVTTASDYHVDSHYKGYGWGASVEIGKQIQLNKSWYVTPQFQAAYASFASNNYTVSNGLDVAIDSGNAPQVRLGAQSGYRIQTSNAQTVSPYVKLSGVQQWSSGGQVTVQDQAYSTSVKGARMDVGAGVNWTFGKGFQLYLDYEFSWAEKYTKPYGLTAGFHYEW